MHSEINTNGNEKKNENSILNFYNDKKPYGNNDQRQRDVRRSIVKLIVDGSLPFSFVEQAR